MAVKLVKRRPVRTVKRLLRRQAERRILRPLRRPTAPLSARVKAQLAANPLYFGASQPEILFVVDPMVGKRDDEEAPKISRPINKRQLQYLTNFCEKHGISVKKCAVLAACPPVTSTVWDSDKRLTTHRKEHRDDFVNVVKAVRPRIIVPLGKTAACQVSNRAVQITKVRGVPVENEEFKCLEVPSFGVAHVIRIPENEGIFDADIETVSKIAAKGYTLNYQTKIKQQYRWVEDLAFLLKNKPKRIAVDTEYTGGEWYDKTQRLLTVQISTEAGVSYAIPIDYDCNPKTWAPHRKGSPERKLKLTRQLKKLLEDPEVEVFGQNFKGDYHVLRERLGIHVANYKDDTILLAHCVDENIKNKALSELTRLYVKDLSGYSDEFDKDDIHEDKSRMDKVPPDKMLMYGCGDTDATFRLCDRLIELAKKDSKNYGCYQKVTMPAQRALCSNEVEGFHIDIEALRRFEKELRAHQEKEYKALLAMVPNSIRTEFIIGKGTAAQPEKPSLTRQIFLLQMLFYHKDGLRLRARVYTKGTTNLKEQKDRVPSTSTKQHLPYFKEHPFVEKLIEYVKNDKLLNTYVGVERDKNGKPTGFYKYVRNGRIRPSYLLHRTVTGRSASVNPNGQNFPKRGKFAKKYREIFVAPPGFVLLQVDYSQMELRVAAMMANDPYMIKLYREGADIHAATAATVMGISLDAFNRLPVAERDLARFRAKAVNFGFLYGMGWRKFIVYAKTEYGIDYTDEQAIAIRAAFFKAYKNLQEWHVKVRHYVRQTGYVRAYDGRARHLQSVFSPDEAVASGAERQAINSPVQAFGSDLGLLAMALINANVDKKLVRVIGFIHDAIVCIAPEAKAKEAAAAIKYWMEHVPLKKLFNFEPTVPIIAEAEVGKNLSKMVEIKDAWLRDETVTHYDHLLYLDWRKRCEKAEQLGEPAPEPVGVNPATGLRVRRKLKVRIKPVRGNAYGSTAKPIHKPRKLGLKREIKSPRSWYA